MEDPKDLIKIKSLKGFLNFHKKHNKSHLTIMLGGEPWLFIVCTDCQSGYWQDKINFIPEE